MQGIFYGIGVGPGDPELMTIKAVKTIRSCDVIAIPHRNQEECAAYRIARQAVEKLEDRECLCLPMPMTKDQDILEASHSEAARRTADLLDQGKNVAFLTLGDSTIYSTCLYLAERLERAGYHTELVNGIPSFCAAAARLRMPLVNGAEELHIIPATYQVESGLQLPGIKVLMKTGRNMTRVKEQLRAGGFQVSMVENCGMDGERVCRTLDEIPDEAGYYSLMIVGEGRQDQDEK